MCLLVQRLGSCLGLMGWGEKTRPICCSFANITLRKEAGRLGMCESFTFTLTHIHIYVCIQLEEEDAECKAELIVLRYFLVASVFNLDIKDFGINTQK